MWDGNIKAIYWVFSSFIELFSVLKCLSNEIYLLTFNWKDPGKRDKIDSKTTNFKEKKNQFRTKQKSDEKPHVFCSCKKYILSDHWKGVKLASWALKKGSKSEKKKSKCKTAIVLFVFRRKKKHTIQYVNTRQCKQRG